MITWAEFGKIVRRERSFAKVSTQDLKHLRRSLDDIIKMRSGCGQGMCTSCKQETTIIREERDVDVDYNADGSVRKVTTGEYRQLCADCV